MARCNYLKGHSIHPYISRLNTSIVTRAYLGILETYTKNELTYRVFFSFVLCGGFSDKTIFSVGYNNLNFKIFLGELIISQLL